MKRLVLVGLVLGVMLAGTAQANSISISYTWTGSELTQSDRLFRNGTASNCAAPKTYPGAYGGGAQGYVLFPFVNASASVACMTVTWEANIGGNYDTFLGAYLDPYDPLNLATNYLGDSGASAGSAPISFSFLVPGNAHFDIVASTVNGLPSAIGEDFTFTIDGSVATVVPEPASLLLLGTGLIGAVRAVRRKRG